MSITLSEVPKEEGSGFRYPNRHTRVTCFVGICPETFRMKLKRTRRMEQSAALKTTSTASKESVRFGQIEKHCTVYTCT